MGEERRVIEESLLSKQIDSKTENDDEEERKNREISWDIYTKELKRICYLSGPMVAVTSSQDLLQVVSIMIVGHLGELYLSSAALAISFAGVTGFSFLVRLENHFLFLKIIKILVHYFICFVFYSRILECKCIIV